MKRDLTEYSNFRNKGLEDLTRDEFIWISKNGMVRLLDQISFLLSEEYNSNLELKKFYPDITLFNVSKTKIEFENNINIVLKNLLIKIHKNFDYVLSNKNLLLEICFIYKRIVQLRNNFLELFGKNHNSQSEFFMRNNLNVVRGPEPNIEQIFNLDLKKEFDDLVKLNRWNTNKRNKLENKSYLQIFSQHIMILADYGYYNECLELIKKVKQDINVMFDHQSYLYSAYFKYRLGRNDIIEEINHIKISSEEKEERFKNSNITNFYPFQDTIRTLYISWLMGHKVENDILEKIHNLIKIYDTDIIFSDSIPNRKSIETVYVPFLMMYIAFIIIYEEKQILWKIQ